MESHGWAQHNKGELVSLSNEGISTHDSDLRVLLVSTKFVAHEIQYFTRAEQMGSVTLSNWVALRVIINLSHAWNWGEIAYRSSERPHSNGGICIRKTRFSICEHISPFPLVSFKRIRFLQSRVFLLHVNNDVSFEIFLKAPSPFSKRPAIVLVRNHECNMSMGQFITDDARDPPPCPAPCDPVRRLAYGQVVMSGLVRKS